MIPTTITIIITKIPLTFAANPPSAAIFAPVTSVANRALYEIFTVYAIILFTLSAIFHALAI